MITALLGSGPVLAGKVFFSDRSSNNIQRANQNGTNVELVVGGVPNVIDIALDPAGGKIYWADSTDGVLRADLDGSNVEDLAVDSEAFGIALDLQAGKVYWTNPSDDTIRRANLDGSNVEEILLLPAGNALGLELDVAGGKLYWSDQTQDTISRAPLDGGGVEVIVTPAGGPRAIALDLAAGKVYWTADTSDAIRRADLNGANVETVVGGLPTALAVAVDGAAGKVYWTDAPGARHIQRASLDGSNVETLIRLNFPHAITLGLTTSCGDAVLDLFEDCDDGNNVDGDGCQSDCALPACGDGVTDAGEACDDDNLEICDGCSATCTIEPGLICGDGILNSICGEQCDDGNTIDGDGCQGDCQLPICGDGIIDDGEQCDDGNNDDADGCRTTCVLPVCGDGIWDSGAEQCDDGNAIDGDGCEGDCRFTANVLYDQLDAATASGVPSQAFESAYTLYDSEGADDFEVTSPEGWDIEVLIARGRQTDVDDAALFTRVAFYADDGGFPVTNPTCVTIVEGIDFFAGQLTLPLPPCQLGPGRWWVAHQVRQDGIAFGQYFWSNRSVQSFNESVWRNPGNAFGTSCVDWSPQRSCGVGGGESPDLLFALLGNETGTGSGTGGGDGGDGPDAVPAVGPFGTIVLGIVLLGAAGYIIRRS